MKLPLSLDSYEEWKHCITELCGIPLTPAYVEARIGALADRSDHGTRRFIETWGEPHLERVKSWFERARTEFRETSE